MTKLLSNHSRRFWANYRASAVAEAQLIGTFFDRNISRFVCEYDHDLVWC